jgi:hypothetical protein
LQDEVESNGWFAGEKRGHDGGNTQRGKPNDGGVDEKCHKPLHHGGGRLADADILSGDNTGLCHYFSCLLAKLVFFSLLLHS